MRSTLLSASFALATLCAPSVRPPAAAAAVNYEVWAGATDYRGQPEPWAYYYDIDAQDYVKLGDGECGAYFPGAYPFYVVVSNTVVMIDALEGSDGSFYSDLPATGNVRGDENIPGAPDGKYAATRNGGSGYGYSSYVVVENPGAWEGLTVRARAESCEALDLVLDFGASGVWVNYNDDPASWRRIHPSDPESMAVGDLDGGGRDDVILDFGASGVWVNYDDDPASWRQVHPSDPESMAVGDLDGDGRGDVILDFGSSGVWVNYDDDPASWRRIHPSSPESMAAGDFDSDPRDDVVFDFGPAGVWIAMNDDALSGWLQVTPSDPELIALGDLDSDGRDDLVVDFGPAQGVWAGYNGGAAWRQIHPLSPGLVAVGDLYLLSAGRDDVVLDFGAQGLWVNYDDDPSDWRQIHTASPGLMTVADLELNGSGDVILGFAGAGEWLFRDNDPAAWSPIHGADAEGVATGFLDGPLAAGTTECRSCHSAVSSFSLAPNVMGDGTDPEGAARPFDDGTWGFSVNGHGAKLIDPDGAAGPEPPRHIVCEDCHDIAAPSGTHLDSVLNTLYYPGKPSGHTENVNTAHLLPSFFPVVSTPEEVYQTTFDGRCYEAAGCHTATAPPNRHRHETTDGDAVMRFGNPFTVVDPKTAVGRGTPYWTPWTMRDLTTDAATAQPGEPPPNGASYGVCVSCHDPHGISGTTRMLRSDPADAVYFCNSNCHRP